MDDNFASRAGAEQGLERLARVLCIRGEHSLENRVVQDRQGFVIPGIIPRAAEKFE